MADPTTEIDDDWLVVDDEAGPSAASIIAPKDPAVSVDPVAAPRRPRPPPLPPSARSASSTERHSDVVARPDLISEAAATAEVDADWFGFEEPQPKGDDEAVPAEVDADWFGVEQPADDAASEAAVAADVSADWAGAEATTGASSAAAEVRSDGFRAEAPSAIALRQPTIPRAPKIPGPADLPGPLIPELDQEEIRAALELRRARERERQGE